MTTGRLRNFAIVISPSTMRTVTQSAKMPHVDHLSTSRVLYAIPHPRRRRAPNSFQGILPPAIERGVESWQDRTGDISHKYHQGTTRCDRLGLPVVSPS